MIFGLMFLAMGYIAVEYRLFFIAFLSGTSTIRDTMVSDSYTGVRILAEAGNVFINSVFHSEDVHKYFVLPLSVFILTLAISVDYSIVHPFRGVITGSIAAAILMFLYSLLGLVNERLQ